MDGRFLEVAAGLQLAVALAALGGLPPRERRSDPRRGVQRRAPGAARGEPGGRPARDEADGSRPAGGAARPRKRPGAAGRVSRDRHGGPRGARHHAGRRVAGRQLPRRGRPDPRDPRRSPAPLLSPAAQDLGRTPGGISARPRRDLGVRRAHRQPLRPADAHPLRARLPARAAPHDRRALGGGDHAADRAGGEPAQGRRDHRQQPGRARGGRRAGGPLDRSRRRGRPRSRTRPCDASNRDPCRGSSRCSWSSGCAITIRA